MSLTKKFTYIFFYVNYQTFFSYSFWAINNPIHLWLAFPNLNHFGVCNFEEVENRQKYDVLNRP